MKPRQLTDFVTKLNRLTQEGRLRWRLTKAPASLTRGSSNPIAAYFECDLMGKLVGIYEERYQDWSEETKEWHWSPRLVLGLFDGEGHQLWEFPDRLAGLNDLWNAVRYRSADVDEYLDSVLAEDDDKNT
jgi:hypothetical protein